jgi:PAS domain S-box-containing protein
MGFRSNISGVRADGTEFSVDARIGPIAIDSDCRTIAIVCDMTEQQALARALGESQRLRAVLEERERGLEELRLWVDAFKTAAIGIVIVDPPTKTFRFANPAFADMHGVTVEKIQGMRVSDLFPAEEQVRFAEFYAELERTGRAMRRSRHLRADGASFPVETDTVSRRDADGAVLYYLASVRDISDQVEREDRIESALREKTLLLDEIHHRVKNNLQVVNSLLYLQASRVGDPVVSAILRESQNRVLSMAIVHQMLYGSKDFSQISFGDFLGNLVPRLVSAYAVDAERISITITAAKTPLPIKAAIPCGIIVNELISNALKHAFPDQRHGEITVTLSENPPCGGRSGYAVLSVCDNGVGIVDSLDLNAANSLGWELVNLFTKQIGGELTIHRADPTWVTLRFPVGA